MYALLRYHCCESGFPNEIYLGYHNHSELLNYYLRAMSDKGHSENHSFLDSDLLRVSTQYINIVRRLSHFW